jgi:hypothetical protein
MKKNKKIQKTAARKAHFEGGKSISTWRGRSTYFINKKKQKISLFVETKIFLNKRICV